MGISASIAGVITTIENDVRSVEEIETEFVTDVKALVQKYAPFLDSASVVHSGGSLSLDSLKTEGEPDMRTAEVKAADERAAALADAEAPKNLAAPVDDLGVQGGFAQSFGESTAPGDEHLPAGGPGTTTA